MMLCYKDKCYCIASNAIIAADNDIKQCVNTKCPNHCAEIPFGELPDYMGIAYRVMHDDCVDYLKEGDQ